MKPEGLTLKTPRLKKHCQVPGCTRVASKKLRTRWRCADHLKATKEGVRT